MEQESKNPRHEGGCIYCGSPGPFSDEHVVCAGLGGDDSAWMLSGCVCRICNTDIFSKLEAKFLRCSPVALARLFLQPQTRKRGAKTGAPSVQPKVSYVRDPATGILVEALLGAGGKSEILAQLVIVDAQRVALTGADTGSVAAFLSELREALLDQVTLIEKRRDGFEVIYEITPLAWTNEAYEVCEPGSSTQPPKGGIWIEPLIRPQTAEDAEVLWPRVYRRPQGHLVCRISGVEHAAVLMTVLRSAPELLNASKVGAGATTQVQPGFHQRYIFDTADDRVLTKIGLNVVAKVLGLGLVRNPGFDGAVGYAREGVGGVYKLPPASSQPLTDMFGPALPDRHALALLPIPRPNDHHALVFMARLYGGPVEAIQLAEFKGEIPGLERPIVVLVDYVNQKIEQPTIEESAIESARKAGTV